MSRGSARWRQLDMAGAGEIGQQIFGITPVRVDSETKRRSPSARARRARPAETNCPSDRKCKPWRRPELGVLGRGVSSLQSSWAGRSGVGVDQETFRPVRPKRGVAARVDLPTPPCARIAISCGPAGAVSATEAFDHGYRRAASRRSRSSASRTS